MKKFKAYFAILMVVSLLCMSTPFCALAAEPDFTLNGAGGSWTSIGGTMTLSGNDTLEILKAPTSGLKINVTSPDNSIVTIKGIADNCLDTYVSVDNDITLNIENLNITAPIDCSGIKLNKTDTDADKMTINVSGNCDIIGTGLGSGISSVHNQNLTIAGNGTLNVTGGSSDIGSLNGNGNGVNMEAYDTTTPAELTIEGDITIDATGGDAHTNSPGAGILVAWGNILVKSGTVVAKSGINYTTNPSSTAGIKTAFPSTDPSMGGNITIEGGAVTGIGGKSTQENVPGAYGIYASNTLKISGGTVAAFGGNSDKNNGGIAITNDAQNIEISGGNVTATGGNGNTNGAHAIYAYTGEIGITNGAVVSAVGGNGTTGIGGVGLRALGYDTGTNTYLGNTVTVAPNAGTVYVRGGQGATVQRASVMGKDVYIATGNIGAVVMQGSNPRSIKNVMGGDDVYMLSASTDPAAAAVVVQSNVNGTLGGNYTYQAATKADGIACM